MEVYLGKPKWMNFVRHCFQALLGSVNTQIKGFKVKLYA